MQLFFLRFEDSVVDLSQMTFNGCLYAMFIVNFPLSGMEASFLLSYIKTYGTLFVSKW